MPYIHFSELSGDSRVWIYQPSRLLTPEEAAAIDSEARAFVGQWTSHNRDLAAWGGVIENLFLVFMVDETHADASGCSIDKSVAFVRDIEQKFQLDFFDRCGCSASLHPPQAALGSASPSPATPFIPNFISPVGTPKGSPV